MPWMKNPEARPPASSYIIALWATGRELAAGEVIINDGGKATMISPTGQERILDWWFPISDLVKAKAFYPAHALHPQLRAGCKLLGYRPDTGYQIGTLEDGHGAVALRMFNGDLFMPEIYAAIPALSPQLVAYMEAVTKAEGDVAGDEESDDGFGPAEVDEEW